MKKAVYIFLIIILSLIIFSLITFMIYVSKNGFYFSGHVDKETAIVLKEKSYKIDDIKKIKINVYNADIEINLTDEDKLTVTEYANKKLKKDKLFTDKKENTLLEISEKNSRWFLNIFSLPKLYVINIPRTFTDNLTIKTVSGDIDVYNDLKNNNLILSTTSGDIELLNSYSKSITLKTVSGDINGKNINSNNIIAKTTSGSIKFNNTKGNVDSKTVSGSIEFESINGKANIKTTSGDITVKDLIITNNSKLSCVSGDIEVVMNKNNDAIISAKTTSGDKNISNKKINKGKYTLTLKTTSGDIDA